MTIAATFQYWNYFLELYQEQLYYLTIGCAAVLIFAAPRPGNGSPHKSSFALNQLLAIVAFGPTILGFVYSPTLESNPFTARQYVFIPGLVAICLLLELIRRMLGVMVFLFVTVFVLYLFFGSYLPGLLETPVINPSSAVAELIGSRGLVAYHNIVIWEMALAALLGQLMSLSGGREWIRSVVQASGQKSRQTLIVLMLVLFVIPATVTSGAGSWFLILGPTLISGLVHSGIQKTRAAVLVFGFGAGAFLTPPIAGSVFFTVAEYTETPYVKLALAILPACCLFYFLITTISLNIRAEASSTDEGRFPLREVLRGWGILVPVGTQMFLSLYTNQPKTGLVVAICAVILFMIHKEGFRQTGRTFLCGIEDATRIVLVILAVLIVVSLFTTVLKLTGLGQTIAVLVVSEDGQSGNTLSAAITSLLLGTILPGASSYVILFSQIGSDATLSQNLALAISTFFSNYTPPIAIGCALIAALAGVRYLQACLSAIRTLWPLLMIPYLMIYWPGLSLEGSAFTVVTALLAVFAGAYLLTVSLTSPGWDKYGAFRFVIGVLLVTPFHTFLDTYLVSLCLVVVASVSLFVRAKQNRASQR
ncbi:MAG: TRAP transporter large permease subunit [Alphaproteobacteria bacterium]